MISALIFLAKGLQARHRSAAANRAPQPPTDDLPPALAHPFAGLIAALSCSLPPLHSLPRPPPPLASTPLHWITTDADLAVAVAALAAAQRVALDLEHHAEHAYYGKTCLMQLSTGTADYVVDAIALRGRLHPLAALLQDPGVCKVVHGGGSDVLWLQRDFGVYLVNVFDTEKACQVLGREQRSLASLLAGYCRVEKVRSGQQADWRQRPLPAPLLEYARTDVHWLLYIADCLGQELVQAGQHGLTQARHHLERQLDRQLAEEGEDPDADGPSVPVGGLPLPAQLDLECPLGRCVQRSQAVSLQVWTAPPAGQAPGAAAAALMRGVVAGRRSASGAAFSEEDVRRLEVLGDCIHALCRWRDSEAKRLDDGVQCVLPDAALLHLAHAAPASEVELLSVLAEAPKAPAASCRYPAVLLAAAVEVAAALEDAAAGQSPWVNPDIQELLRPGALAAGASGRRRQEDPAALRARLGQRFGCKRAAYENCRMLAADGQLLCHCDRKRLEWYVSKGLATLECEDPLTVRLTFAHRDGDQRKGGAEFFTSARVNRCVACGEGSHYLRWRVVPTCYRKALPVALKSHRSHDVVLLCVGCHQRAQTAVELLKREVSEEYNVPLLPPLPGPAPTDEAGAATSDAAMHPFNVRRAALALHAPRARDIPQARRAELQGQVRAYVAYAEPALASAQGEGTDDLTPGELWAGMLAGLGPQARRRMLRRWAAQGCALPAPLAEEISPAAAVRRASSNNQGAEAVESPGPAELRGNVGHLWHGQRVVEAALASGGEEELYRLCARFRRRFVETLHPRFLPVGWEVEHSVPREFGDYSVYASTVQRADEAEGAGSEDEGSAAPGSAEAEALVC